MGVSPETSVVSGTGVSGGLGVGGSGVSKLQEFIQNFPLLSSLIDSVTGASLTLARASSKTFIKDSGAVETVTSNNAAFTGSGILIEPSHTNLFLRSRQYDSASWAKLSVTVGANTGETTDPIGTNTADKITASASGFVRIGQTVTVVNDTVMVSFCGKSGSTDYVNLRCGNPTFTNFCDAWFDLSDGSIGTNTENGAATFLDKGSIDLGDGWFYCYVIVDGFVGTSCETRLFVNDADGGPNTATIGQYVYLWQADCQEGSSRYSPVETTTAAATSLKDDYTVGLANIPANDFYIEFDWTPLSAPVNGDYLLSFHDGVSGNEIYIGTGLIESNGGCFISSAGVSVGTTYTIRLTRTSAGGETLSVSGIGSDNEPTATGDITWPSEGNVGSRYTDANHSHSVIAHLKWDNA